jgi:transposase-like protein
MRERGKQARAKWRKIVSEQAGSGQSVAAFCRARGVCAPQFFAWKKRLREAAAAEFVEMKLAVAATGETTEPMVPRGAACGVPIEVRLKNHRSLLVGPRFDANHLRALLAVVESGA